MILLFSCKSQRNIPVESETKIIEKDKLIPVVNPADSAAIRALLECDENGKVVLRWFDMEKSKNMQLQFSLDSLGNLLARAKTARDTIYLPSKEIEIERKISVPYPVEKELTKWQKIKMKLGGWALTLIITFSLMFVGWLIYKVRKKVVSLHS